MKKTLLIACLFAACSFTLPAQTTSRSRIIHTKEKSAIHVPPQQAPAGLKKIYSNLGTQTDLYNDQVGFAIYGPGFGDGYEYVYAAPFTPKSDAHVSQVGAAIHYLLGDNQINLSIYGDAGGLPGTLLAGPVTVTNLPEDGTCCALAVGDFTPLAVTGGTRYWVVADTPLTGTGSDFFGQWCSVAKIVPVADNGGNGWYATSANLLPAFEVLGTIP